MVRGNVRRRALPPGREGRLATVFRSDRSDRDQPERHGCHRAACLRGHAVPRPAGVRPACPALDGRRERAAVDQRHRARRRWRPSVRRHGQRTGSHSTMSRFHRLALAAVLAAPIPLLGDVGVLIPSGSSGPDPAILSLDQMAVDIRIDNGDARVSVRQVFASHRGGVLEGEYLFSMPSRATVSDFAVWDGVTRIPGVILERRRAEEIYENLKQEQIDPGLLQQGERGTESASEATRTSAFSARIVPIPGYGTKRLEMEYHEAVPVENLHSTFALPLRPDAYNALSAGQLTISFSLVSAHAIRDFRAVSRAYPLEVREQTAHGITATFAGRNVTFAEDFSVEYALDAGKTDTLEVVTYRRPEPGAPAGETVPRPRAVEPGFFQASALVAPADQTEPGKVAAPVLRTVIALFDTSLSMQWEKLQRSFQALEAVLRALRPGDRFNVLLFNTDTTPFTPAPV